MEKKRRSFIWVKSVALILMVAFLVLLGLAQPQPSLGATKQNKPGEKIVRTSNPKPQYYLYQHPSQALKKAPLASTSPDYSVLDPLNPSDQKELRKKSYKDDEVLIKFKPGTAQINAKAIMNAEKVRPMKHYKMVDVHLAKTPPGRSVEDTIKQLKKNPSVEYAEPNYIRYVDAVYPNDADFHLLWGLHNTDQTGGTADADIDAPEAWEVETGSPDVIIAVIDTGVDYAHVDLTDNMWVNPGEISGDGIDNDGNGYVDDMHGINAINGSGDPMDDHFHGTHCAGTIAAQGNNGAGVTGVSWFSRIMALKFLGASGGGADSDAIECIEYMVNMKNSYGVNVKVSSNSWGGGGDSIALKDAIHLAQDSDILFIAAAGNSSSDNDMTPHYPSNYDCLNVISVAASDHNDSFASFSCFGYNTVDVAAPGVSIWSTKPGNDYRYLSGTSMATPHVAGLCGLIVSHFPGMNYLDIKERLLRTVDTKSHFIDFLASGGRVNAYAALTTTDIQGPFIFSLVPGAASFGYQLVIEGSQFGANQGTGYVTFFDNQTASVQSWSDHQIVCIVPVGCQTGPVTVTTDEGLQSNEKRFTLAASISGRVTDETSGDGIENVMIRIYDSSNDKMWSDQTDADGDYRIAGLPAGDYYVRAVNYNGYINEWYGDVNPSDCVYPIVHAEVPDDTPNVDFSLQKGGVISGQVRSSSSGNGLEDVQVALYDTNYYRWYSVLTDANGNYMIDGLPTQGYIVRAYPPSDFIAEYYNDALCFTDATAVPVVAPNTISGIDFVLAAGGSISGRVTDGASGVPLLAVNVSASASGSCLSLYKSAFTDSEGNYTITGLPTGAYRVNTFNAEGYIDEYFNNVLEYQSSTLVNVGTPNNTPGINFALATGGSISGHVTDTIGEPLESIYLTAANSNRWISSRSAYSDSNGNYHIAGLPTGDYFVQARDSNHTHIDTWYQGIPYASEDADPPVRVAAPDVTADINFALSLFDRDAHEDDNTKDEARFITANGVPQIRTLYPEWDEDWIKFIAQVNTSYVIDIFDVATLSSVHLFLYDNDGETLLKEDPNAGYTWSEMEYNFTSAGTYYLKVKRNGEYDCFIPGLYNIRVSPRCLSSSDCSDGLFCNGMEMCMGRQCIVHTEDPCSHCRSYGCTCDEAQDTCVGCSADEDCDGICDPGASGPNCSGSDSCPGIPNGPYLGICTWSGMSTCTTDYECADGPCSMNQEDEDHDQVGDACDICPDHYNPGQEDTLPPQGNGVGDACECEGDFSCDGDVDGSDASMFKFHFGRSISHYQCSSLDPCRGDFACDGDVDGTDAILFKSDFGRNAFNSPCAGCVMEEWCAY